eukprot:TRINITY_DN8637_c0_g1_i1.p1 TRINITY_DN8637_c0_g1~~TRINITY_DN8637_c0_g1_i1.p1  ORF type:complete len:319 (+),score=41.58 TRINITY_DN8637_c0_g1_i1:762-1718(+)
MGAVWARDVACLHSIWMRPLGGCHLDESMCLAIGLQLARVGDDGSGFSWLAAQQGQPSPWPACYADALCNTAAMWGHTTTLQFLVAQDGQFMFGASESGTASPGDGEDALCFPSLTFTDVVGTEHDLTLTDAAAAADDTAPLQWLQSQHAAEFTSITMQMAAANGRLANLKWLRAHGCPHDINAVCQTLWHNNSATPPSAAWVRSCGGGDWSPRGMTLMLEAALLDATPTMARWLRAEGAWWPEDLAVVVATDIKHLTPSPLCGRCSRAAPSGGGPCRYVTCSRARARVAARPSARCTTSAVPAPARGLTNYECTHDQ